jgi:hypothetical protein
MIFPTKLNIGSGKDFREDYLNLDVGDYYAPDIIYDLNQPLPEDGVYYVTERFGEVVLTKGIFEQIIANDVLEHISNLTVAMTTCLDLLRVGGSFDISVPYDLSLGAWQDPTHIRAFNENSWLYYTDWFWYLGWTEAKFIHNEQISLQLSEFGQLLHASGTAMSELLQIPRAVDAMSVSLRKVLLSPDDRRQLEHFRGQSRKLQSAVPTAAFQQAQPSYCIWIVSPPGYVHTATFAELARGLQAGLAQLGYDAPIVDNPERCSGKTIVLGANLLSRLENTSLPDDIVIYNTEQIQTDSDWMTSDYKSILSSYPVWDYSKRNLDSLQSLLGKTDVTLCPIGYQPELTSIRPIEEQDIDVFFYGSINDRRAAILDELEAQGLTVVFKFGVYGAQRDAYIARAKIIINIHYYEAKVFEIVRVSYLLANSKFVISEASLDAETESHLHGGLVICPYEELVQKCLMYVGDNEGRRAIAKRGFELFKQRSQAEYLSEALKKA